MKAQKMELRVSWTGKEYQHPKEQQLFFVKPSLSISVLKTPLLSFDENHFFLKEVEFFVVVFSFFVFALWPWLRVN